MIKRDPTEDDLKAMYTAFYRTPIYDKLDVPSPPPDPNWWPGMRDALARVWHAVMERVDA